MVFISNLLIHCTRVYIDTLIYRHVGARTELRFMRVEEMEQWMNTILHLKNGSNRSVCLLIQGLYLVLKACLMESTLYGKKSKSITSN